MRRTKRTTPLASRPRRKIALVFGEDDNDRSALIEIVKAIRPDASVSFQKRAKPLVLLRSDTKPNKRASIAEDIASLVRAAQVADDVVCVIAHRDCDAIEPAHLQAAIEIEAALDAVGVQNAIAATPAFEMEAWWMLFPEALRATRPCWALFSAGGKRVGLIANAKEHLIGALRPLDRQLRSRCPDYSESDSITISKRIRENNLIRRVKEEDSGSLYSFMKKVDALQLTR